MVTTAAEPDIRIEDVNIKYRPFVEAFPTYLDRINAMLAWIAPDPKVALLLYMQDGEEYNLYEELYEDVADFLGVHPDEMPVTDGIFRSYIKGDRSRNEGCLTKTYALDHDGRSARKTPVGEDFAGPVAARALRVAAQLEEHETAYRSLLRILRIPGRENGYTLRLATFQAVEFLMARWKAMLRREPDAQAPIYSNRDIAAAIGIEAGSKEENVLNAALIFLGEAGIAPYCSAYRQGTEKGKGFSTYRLDDRLRQRTPQQIVDEVTITFPGYTLRGVMERVVTYMRNHPHECHSRISLSKATGIAVSSVGETMGLLRKLGYIEKDKKGATPTGITRMVWETLLEPIGLAALYMEPHDWTFREVLDEYEDDKLRTEHLVTMMGNYDAERAGRGRSGAEEVEVALLKLHPGIPMKLADITVYANAQLEGRRTLTGGGIGTALQRLVRQDYFTRNGNGFYTRTENIAPHARI